MTWPPREHSGPGGLGFGGIFQKGGGTFLPFCPQGKEMQESFDKVKLEGIMQAMAGLTSSATSPGVCCCVFESLLQSLGWGG